ncbi:MAG: hypothetical protein J5736_02425, partial [Bacilli bacterium]|nr:hypothetical protein [Bacilli bacterium]
NGDYDGIDSNGNIYIEGGIMITAGPNQMMASAFDVEKTASMSGGTLICFGALEKDPSFSASITKSKLSGSYSTGTYDILIGETTIRTGALTATYSNCTAFSELGSLVSVTRV